MNETLRDELLEMARLDRTVRAELAASGELFDVGYEPRMARVHERNARRLLRIMESVGWPGTDLVGPDGAEAAWVVLQHAIAEPDLLRRALPLLQTAAREGRACPRHAALLEDRIRFFEGRPQRYGDAVRLGRRRESVAGRSGRSAAAGRAAACRRTPATGRADGGSAHPGDLRGRPAAGRLRGVRKSPRRVGGKRRMARRLNARPRSESAHHVPAGTSSCGADVGSVAVMADAPIEARLNQRPTADLGGGE